MGSLLKKQTNGIPLISLDKIKRIPYRHQVEGAEFILEKKKCILGDAMGLGKTFTTLLAAESIEGRKLIICPSILKLNWEREIKETRDGLKVYIISGRKQFPDYIENNSYTIINYDIVNSHLKNIIKVNYDVLILDEAHYIKAVDNYGKPSSNRARSVLYLSKFIEYRICVTGTPVPNRIKDLFNILNVIENPLGKNFYKFTAKYCNARITEFGRDINGSSNLDELHEKLEDCMIRRLSADIPEKVRKFIPVDVSLKEYKAKTKEYIKRLKDDNKNLKHMKETPANYKALTRNEKLVYLNALKMILEEEKAPKTIEYADYILESEKNVVIFANYRKTIDILRAHYGDKCVVIDGRTNAEEKEIALAKFQNGNADVFIAGIKAAGIGINLTCASNVIFCGYPWSSSDLEQAEDRIHRIGQHKVCTIHYIYAPKADIDRVLTETVDRKMGDISRTVDGVEMNFTDELIDLFE